MSGKMSETAKRLAELVWTYFHTPERVEAYTKDVVLRGNDTARKIVSNGASELVEFLVAGGDVESPEWREKCAKFDKDLEAAARVCAHVTAWLEVVEEHKEK